MNRRQAKKYLRNPRRQPANFLRPKNPREVEALRKAKGKWSPWRLVKLRMSFTVSEKDVACAPISMSEEMMRVEDVRILRVIEEAVVAAEAPLPAVLR